jgi:hypothetical protein
MEHGNGAMQLVHVVRKTSSHGYFIALDGPQMYSGNDQQIRYPTPCHLVRVWTPRFTSSLILDILASEMILASQTDVSLAISYRMYVGRRVHIQCLLLTPCWFSTT